MKKLVEIGILLLTMLTMLTVTGIAFASIGDEDSDGILDDFDLCPGSVPDTWVCDSSVTMVFDNPKPNHWQVYQICTLPFQWAVLIPNLNAQGWFRQIEFFSYGAGGTQGCTCSQIIDYMEAATGESLDGHRKHACSKSLIQDFMSMID